MTALGKQIIETSVDSMQKREWSMLPLQRPAERPGNPVEWHGESRCFQMCKLKPVSLDFPSCALDKMQPFIIKWI